MTRIIIPAVCLLCGIGIGWLFGYTRPTAKNQRELLAQYQNARDKFHMTDADMADFGEHRQEYAAAMKRQDEMAAGTAYGALVRLERGDVEVDAAADVVGTTDAHHHHQTKTAANPRARKHRVGGR